MCAKFKRCLVHTTELITFQIGIQKKAKSQEPVHKQNAFEHNP